MFADVAYHLPMATRPGLTPNRRGVRSRELVLDAAERLISEHGYEAATVAALKEEAGIPMSSIYHHFRSREGVIASEHPRYGTRRGCSTGPLDRCPRSSPRTGP